jgi:hypothetical protein
VDNQIIQCAPTYIPVLNDSAGFWVQVVLAVITFLAVGVALFQERIKDFLNMAKLSPIITPSPPDCHQIELRSRADGERMGNAIYLRIRVQHVGGKTAYNVEAILSRVQRKNEKGKWTIVKEFLPMNLQWSHIHAQRVTLPPDSFRHCNLGSFRQINMVNQFLIDTIVQPNAVSGGKIPNLLHYGVYKFDILFTGDNVKPINKTWIIDFSPSWTNDEDEMLKKYIKIKEVL